MNRHSYMICDDLARREALLAHPTLNGIDYIEVPNDDQQNIRVYFIKQDDIPDLTASQVRIEGGVRIQNIQVQRLDPTKKDENSKKYLEVSVDNTGDFSTYTLSIDSPGQIDIAFSRQPFSFKAGCSSDFDCQKKIVCPTEPKEEPNIDYLAKDYASFRRALLDLIPTKVPQWVERHEADLGITLVELLAYVGDQLSYYQDAVANEAYLETARHRESVKRHARLIDYNLHDGSNARTFIHVTLKHGTSGTIPAGTAVLSRINVPLGSGLTPPYGPEIANSVRTQALSVAEVVFETAEQASFDWKLNRIKIHTWGNRLCCLPRGATTLYLVGDLPFEKDDLLLLEEVKGVETGVRADANLCQRQVVRLVYVEKTEDPLDQDPATGVPPLKLTHVKWHRSDALTFPLCLSVQLEDGTVVEDVSVARGNLVLADHGRRVEEWHPSDPNTDPAAPGIKKGNVAYRFELQNEPITFHTPEQKNEDEKPSVREMLEVDPCRTTADVCLEFHEDGPLPPQWKVVPQLLESNPFDRHFIVETKENNRANIRFGDGKFGMEPAEGSHIKVTYRVGNGGSGNVGGETLVHILQPPDPVPTAWPDIEGVRNPLPAWGGTEPETMSQAKLLAPKAFHAEQYRAVTENDYARAAEKHFAVDRAVATYRWTGSWHTVFITIDPVGRADVPQELESRVRAHLARYKLAGYDIDINPPIYVSLEIEINICVARDHFRAHVKEALLEALGNQELPSDRKGFFHPDNFTFGEPVYLSELYKSVESIDGVVSAEVIKFKQLGKLENNELGQGFIPMGRLEIARLDNDPNFPENGILSLNMMAGK